ncbi:MAG: hypothetical protein U9N14_04325, partial [Pseudomonadota bacterium]|nr:hypothetical protein [Pseudomonadota bacterium]
MKRRTKITVSIIAVVLLLAYCENQISYFRSVSEDERFFMDQLAAGERDFTRLIDKIEPGWTGLCFVTEYWSVNHVLDFYEIEARSFKHYFIGRFGYGEWAMIILEGDEIRNIIKMKNRDVDINYWGESCFEKQEVQKDSTIDMSSPAVFGVPYIQVGRCR